MKRASGRICLSILAIALVCGAQAKPPSPTQHSQDSAKAKAGAVPTEVPPQQVPERELAEVSNQAAGREEKGEPDEQAAFRQSPSVKFLAKHLHLSPATAYWGSIVFNFLIIAIAVLVGLKKLLPAMFRTRTEVIRKNLEEAQRASADANRRLREIEEKLSRLGEEVSGLEKQAAAAANAEQARMQAAAEEEKQKIISAAEQEIAAAASSARRDLKAYAAELAISLAENKIKVDAATDHALVREFIARLGKNGN